MIGMDRTTGKAIADDAHLAQSLGDLFSTPIGTRTMRRDYGSMLPLLVDQPLNRATAILFYAATALAIARFEPRIALTRVAIAGGDLGAAAGQVAITIEGTRTDVPGPTSLTTLTIPLRSAS